LRKHLSPETFRRMSQRFLIRRLSLFALQSSNFSEIIFFLPTTLFFTSLSGSTHSAPDGG
jgi:hypothetical protein